MAAPKDWSISADWIATARDRPIRHGIMRGRGAVIQQVGPAGQISEGPNHRTLSGVAILPGLVNAHTHLELTHLRGVLPPRRPMTQWLFGLMSRHATGRKQDASVAEGAREALTTGTSTLADISHNNRAWRILKTTALRKVCFAEVTGIGPLAHRAIPKLRRRLEGVRPDTRLRFGITPHAPYSTSEEVYRKAVALAKRRRCPITTHLAETEAERQFLQRGSGKFFELLGRLGLVDSSLTIHGCKPIIFAQRVGLFECRSLLAHVNYIDDEELDILSRSGASVVYCPRSSDFFGHTGHRYPEMLDAGINVALGTDSLASNRSLEMLEEMRRVRADGRVTTDTILQMATLNGAKALGMEDRIGTLEPGKQADWIAVPVPQTTGHPVEAILTTRAKVVEVTIAGKTVFPARNKQEL